MKSLTDVLNDENRLVRVQGPGSVDVAYSYDSLGRMLTRYDGGPDITQLTWDNWDCIKEVTGESETVYHIPEGQILSFIRDGLAYNAHRDALGNIRMVTDQNGEVVLRREFDAWGQELAGNFDNIPGGMSYGFIGALGLRFDNAARLIYVRQRWYDLILRRFISRDRVRSVNRYNYARNNPVSLIDRNGKFPESAELAGTYLRLYERWRHREPGGLRQFCQILNEASDATGSNEDFLQLTQALFVDNTSFQDNPAYRLFLQPSDMQVDNDHALRPGMQGWNNDWHDGHDQHLGPTGITHQDQAHHLVAYLVAGFKGRPTYFKHALDKFEDNQGDIRLGYLGVDSGDDLQWHNPRPGETVKDCQNNRKKWIKNLCSKLSRRSDY